MPRPVLAPRVGWPLPLHVPPCPLFCHHLPRAPPVPTNCCLSLRVSASRLIPNLRVKSQGSPCFPIYFTQRATLRAHPRDCIKLRPICAGVLISHKEGQGPPGLSQASPAQQGTAQAGGSQPAGHGPSGVNGPCPGVAYGHRKTRITYLRDDSSQQQRDGYDVATTTTLWGPHT